MLAAKNGVDTGFQEVFIGSRTCLSSVLFGAELFVTLGCFGPICTFKLIRVKKLTKPTFWAFGFSFPSRCAGF